MDSRILLIYTGGTIGMKQDPVTKLLKPFDFNQIMDEVPDLAKFGYHIDNVSFNPVIDSSDVSPDFWVRLAGIIEERYELYDGFVVLHGTDTMAYSASVLSFMLEDLEKPVIFTGSQLPIGMLRTDGKENLISSIELAAARDGEGHPMVPEVCVFFESRLYRGNCTRKFNAEDFNAFRSENCPVLAEAGIHIRFNRQTIVRPNIWERSLKVHTALDTRVAVLKIFPGIRQEAVDACLAIEGLRAVVLETFGSGNAPSDQRFLDSIASFTAKGGIVVNVTQCPAGSVNMETYANGEGLKRAGAVSGRDMTTEAVLAKLFVLMGQSADNARVRVMMGKNLRGEFSNK